MLFNTHKVGYSVKTQHQYIVNNTQLWLHVSILRNHPQANIYYVKIYPMYLYPYLLTDLLTYFHTYLFTDLLSYLLTYEMTDLLIYFLT